MGDNDVTLIYADANKESLILYSNCDLNGYDPEDGEYVKRVRFEDMSEEALKSLKGFDSRFYSKIFHYFKSLLLLIIAS